ADVPDGQVPELGQHVGVRLSPVPVQGRSLHVHAGADPALGSITEWGVPRFGWPVGAGPDRTVQLVGVGLRVDLAGKVLLAPTLDRGIAGAGRGLVPLHLPA